METLQVTIHRQDGFDETVEVLAPIRRLQPGGNRGIRVEYFDWDDLAGDLPKEGEDFYVKEVGEDGDQDERLDSLIFHFHVAGSESPRNNIKMSVTDGATVLIDRMAVN